MCDLMLGSSPLARVFSESLPVFASLGSRNCHGWGLAYLRGDGRFEITRSAEPAADAELLHASLGAVAATGRTTQLVAHLRLASVGCVCTGNCHPFGLDFLGQHWAFAHNGTCRDIVDYETLFDRVDEADSDSARVFEFLRDHVVDHTHPLGRHRLPLGDAVASATSSLLSAYPYGTFNFVLATAGVSWLCSHHRPFWCLPRLKDDGGVFLATTIDGGLTDGEPWEAVGDQVSDCATLLTVVGGHVLRHDDVAAGQ